RELDLDRARVLLELAGELAAILLEPEGDPSATAFARERDLLLLALARDRDQVVGERVAAQGAADLPLLLEQVQAQARGREGRESDLALPGAGDRLGGLLLALLP